MLKEMPDNCFILLTARVMVLDGAGVHHGLLHVAEGGEQPRVPPGRARRTSRQELSIASCVADSGMIGSA